MKKLIFKFIRPLIRRILANEIRAFIDRAQSHGATNIKVAASLKQWVDKFEKQGLL
jgi:hypothetical protein